MYAYLYPYAVAPCGNKERKKTKIGDSVEKVKRSVTPINRIVSQLQSDSALVKEQLSTVRCFYKSELARFWILSCKSLVRMHQILIKIISFIQMLMSEHTEASQLAFEFLRTATLFKVPSVAINNDQIL